MNKKDIDHILNSLRRGTVTWSGRSECLNRRRRKKVVGETKKGTLKTRFEYQCAECKKWLKKEDLEVDHIEEVGPFNGDFNEWIARLYCDQNNLQALCVDCHQIKTSGYNASLRYKRKREQ